MMWSDGRLRVPARIDLAGARRNDGHAWSQINECLRAGRHEVARRGKVRQPLWFPAHGLIDQSTYVPVRTAVGWAGCEGWRSRGRADACSHGSVLTKVAARLSHPSHESGRGGPPCDRAIACSIVRCQLRLQVARHVWPLVGRVAQRGGRQGTQGSYASIHTSAGTTTRPGQGRSGRALAVPCPRRRLLRTAPHQPRGQR